RYGDHPYTREMPEASDVATVTPDQVRALHRSAVLPRGSALVVVGDLDLDQAVALIESAMAGWTSEASAVELPDLPEVAGGDLLVVHRPGAVQSQLRMSAHAVRRTHPRYPALQLANLAFGGLLCSRL